MKYLLVELFLEQLSTHKPLASVKWILLAALLTFQTELVLTLVDVNNNIETLTHRHFGHNMRFSLYRPMYQEN